MFQKIKKFLLDRGWYSIPKFTRHIVGSAFLVLFFVGITEIITGVPVWPLAGLIVFVLSLLKEIFVDKGTAHVICKDMLLNITGILLALTLWIF